MPSSKRTSQVATQSQSQGGRKRAKATNVYKPRRGLKANILTQVNLGAGFPLQAKFTHKYSEINQITSTTGVTANYKFNCNGMYDPNNSGGGHQPIYFDQMTNIYNHYCVLKSTMKWRVMPQSAAGVACYVAMYINDDSTSTPTGVDNAVEVLDGQVRLLPQGKNDSVVFTSTWDAKRLFGGSILSNTELQGSASANPTEFSTWNLVLIAADGASTVTLYFEVEIVYEAVWKELRDIPSS